MGMDNKMIQTTKEVVPVIYAYTTPEIARHDGWTKIGDTGRETGECKSACRVIRQTGQLFRRNKDS